MSEDGRAHDGVTIHIAESGLGFARCKRQLQGLPHDSWLSPESAACAISEKKYYVGRICRECRTASGL